MFNKIYFYLELIINGKHIHINMYKTKKKLLINTYVKYKKSNSNTRFKLLNRYI